jgi:phenylacetate-CoA ligase
VFTCRSMMPLVRYNIHDRGGNLSYRFVVDTLRAHGYDARALLGELGWTWKRLYPLPFFYVFGRTDGTTTIYGVNVYTEDISEALSDRELVDLHTGEFQLATTFDGNAEQHLTLTVRLRPHAEPAPAVIERFRQRVVETLVAKNAEYRHLHEVKGGRVVPSVELTHHPVRANKQAIKQKYHMV